MKYSKNSRKRYVKKRRVRKRIGHITKFRSSGLAFPFPRIFRTTFRTVMTGGVQHALGGADGNAADLFFKFNALTWAGICNNYPLGSGLPNTFAQNVPAGLAYMLGTDNVGSGALGIYSKYLVRSSSIKFEYATEGVTSKAQEIIIVPRDSVAVNLTTASNTVAERPFAKAYCLPPVNNTKPYAMTRKCGVKELFGLQSLSTTDYDFVGTCDSGVLPAQHGNPAQTGLWQVRIRNLDGTAQTREGSYKATLSYEVVLFAMNGIISSVPA